MEEIYDEFIKALAKGFVEARTEHNDLDTTTYVGSAVEFLRNEGNNSRLFLLDMVNHAIGLHGIDPLSTEDSNFAKNLKFVLATQQIISDMLLEIKNKIEAGEIWVTSGLS